jgi:hypothetical protein
MLLILLFIPSFSIFKSAQAITQPSIPTFNPANIPPFNPSTAINCNMTEVNAKLANNPLAAIQKQRPAPLSSSDAQPLTDQVSPADDGFNNHYSWGTYFYSKTTNGYQDVIGVEAMQYIEPALTLPAGDMMYAPSFKGPEPQPLEVSTEYTAAADGVMSYILGIYDWSVPGWTNWANSFYWLQSNNYVATYEGVEYYSIVEHQDSNGNWGMFLCQFSGTDPWVEQYSTPNGHNVQNGYGQDYYEVFWNTGNWPTNVAYIESSNQMVQYLTSSNPQTWTWSLAYSNLGLTTGNMWSDSWLKETHGWYGQYYDWYVGTHP